MSSSRFDLDKAIAAWRRPFEHNHTFSSEDLDELEGSLRDRIEALVETGRPEEAAFREAVRRAGSYAAAEAEYRKVYWGKVRRQHQLRDELQRRLSMLANYLKIAFRNLLRQKGYSFINIAGLTIGLTCCLLIFQYVAFEYSFDDFNENASRLYRVILTEAQGGGESHTSPLTGYAMGPALGQEVPEVVQFTRLHPEYGPAIVSNPSNPAKTFEERRVYYTDPAFFQMFSYPLVYGDLTRALVEPGTVLLSESAARKYFGSEDPVGQVIDVTGWVSGTYRVEGVFRDVPSNSHLQFDILLPMANLLQGSYQDPLDAWNWVNFITYVQLRADADPADIESKGTSVLRRHLADVFESPMSTSMEVQPLQEIHLNEDIRAPMAEMGSYQTVHFFTLIGLVTLLIALMNYINLATAQAMGRAREVGVRKVVGAQRVQLVTQFLYESALTNGMAVTLAVALSLFLRPVVNTLTGASLTNVIWTSPIFWSLFVAAFCAATLVAGLYPAFVLSSFRPVVVLKGNTGTFATGVWLRRGLVVVQFAAAILLLVGTTVVYKQLDFMRHMDLGIDLEQILTVPAPRVLPEGTQRAEAVETFRQEVRQLPAVRQTATSSTIPGQGFAFSSTIGKATDPSKGVTVFGTHIDTAFASLYGLKLLAGSGFRDVSHPTPEGEDRPLIANETAIRAVGFNTPEEAIGQKVGIGQIVGVFKDFNWSSAHQAPANAFFILSRGESTISIRVGTENLPQTLAAIEQVYQQLFPGNPFRYAFVDEQFDQQYRNDQRFAALFSIFASLAMAIACLGLFGLASFTAQQRTNEIGIRKVLGASVPGIVVLLSKDFIRLVAIAFAVGAPVAYVTIQGWLDNFAYRIEIGPAIFLVTGALVLVIALLTVSNQAIRVALADPVKSLRYE